MPTFRKPATITPTRVGEFTIRATVHEANDGAKTVELSFSAITATTEFVGGTVDQLQGDLTPYLTPAQINNFTAAALALHTQARAELLV